MTEKEAKRQPCIGPAPDNTGVPAAKSPVGGMVYMCRGETCLAWRWGASSDRWRDNDDRRPGHCGLAGKP